MPFKLRLKKSKQYNVVTKAVFVICVELLDNSIVECTLSADSHGYDCLDNVCQRLGLNQPEFFGLRYVSQKSYPRVRWVELDRPLKKQLDKHAQEAYLYLRIMYYVNDVSLLQDEMTRYHYFLQLKSDVMEGRLRCSYNEAIVLAGYRLQAEFGDHDPERHTLQYLKEFALVPKHLVTNETQLDAVTEAVAEQHSKLLGLPQPVAECWYIVEAQHLDGYGQERFLAKEEPAGEALVATSLQGILVMRNNTERVVFYRWDDITNLLNQKRMFGIECQRSEENVQFYFDDPEAARYVWKLAVLQHTFYKQTLLTLQSLTLQSQSADDKESELATGIGTLNLDPAATLQSSGIAATSTTQVYEQEHNQQQQIPHQQLQQQQFQQQQRSSSAMGMINEYRPEFLAQSLLNGGPSELPHSVSSPSLSVLNSNTQVNITTPRSSGASTGESLATSQQNLRALLPAYRPAPDYETAVRVKYGDEMANLLLHQPVQTIQPAMPELNPVFQQQLPSPQQLPSQQIIVQQMQMMHLYKPPPPYPYSKTGSNSSPDLAVAQNGAAFSINTGSVGHLPTPHSATGMENESSLVYPTGDSGLQHSEQHLLVKNGEPIYQNVPMRQLGSNPSLSSATVNRSQASLQHLQQLQQHGSPKRKWVIPGLSSQRGRNAPRTAVINPNPSPSVQPQNTQANVKDHLRQEVESRLADGQLLLEFELIPRRKAGADFGTAAHSDNVSRNQYQDVLPYEENRVRLMPSRDNKMGYINASHISAAVGSAQRFYIAAQGPLSSTVNDFYQMIWENDVYVVVMLAETNKGGSQSVSNLHMAHSKSVHSLRSHPSNSSMSGYSGFVYWPQQDSAFLEFGEFKVKRQFCNTSARHSTTKLDVTHVPSGKQRNIWHLQYFDWADHGCPKDVTSFLSFLEDIDTVRRHSVAEVPVGKNSNTPVLVHCGAGVGRTGVAIACDVLLTWLDNNIVVDVPKLITHLRQQRMLMVQTVAQYRLIYAVLLCYLDRSRLI